MLYIQIITVIAALLTIFFSYDGYKKDRMDAQSFKFICICESIVAIGTICLIFF